MRKYIFYFLLFGFFHDSLAVSGNGFDIAIVNSQTKVKINGDNIKASDFVRNYNISLAGDEAESFQLVIVPKSTLKKVTITIKPVKENKALTLKYYKVDYVKTGNPSYPVSHVGLWPDVLLSAQEFGVAPAEVQPIWFTVAAEPNCTAGTYLYVINVSSEKDNVNIPIRVIVRNFSLPRPGKFQAPFGLYGSTLSLRYYGESNKLAVKDYLKWADFINSYRLTPKEIGTEYVKVNNGKSTVDMSVLKNTIGKLYKQYPDYTYSFYRLPTGERIKKALSEKAEWCTPEKMATLVKQHYQQWLKEGLPEKAYLYGFDEPNDPEVFDFAVETYKAIKKQVPHCKIMQTGNCNKKEFIGLVDIWCPKTPIASSDFFKERVKAGDILWDYICVSPVHPYPNFFVDEQGVNHRVLFWQTKKINATGLLYWSTTHWQQSALDLPSSNPHYPNTQFDYTTHFMYKNAWQHVTGDGVLLYPGKNLEPISSIRLEIIRDGIEDYEYLALLDDLIGKVSAIAKYKTAEGRSLLTEARKLAVIPDYITKSMAQFTSNPEDLLHRREAVGNMIEQLSDIINNRDYEKKWNYNMPTGDKN